MRSRINNSSDPARRSGSKVIIKSQNLNKAKHALKQPIEDDYLDTDSEVDEFAAEGAQAGPSGSSDEEGDPASDEDDAEEEGVGLWQPDDWGGGEAEGSGSGSDSESENEERLQDDIRQIPLSTLMKAQKSLRAAKKGQKQAPVQTDMERLAAAKSRLADMQRMKGKGKAIEVPQEAASDDESEGSQDGTGRRNKHAPAMMSTKRQVSRHRQAIALPKREVRDPRFSSISGDLNVHLHSQAYSFLPDMLKDEYHDLRRKVAAAQKAERTCPMKEKQARVEEREKLELDLGRLRTKMDRSKADAREREVLAQVKKEEREKRGEGKGAWFMKKGEKKDLLLKARFEALEQAGGKRAVKKAVDKKRKKVAGKEKKSRPDGAGGGDSKRRRVA